MEALGEKPQTQASPWVLQLNTHPTLLFNYIWTESQCQVDTLGASNSLNIMADFFITFSSESWGGFEVVCSTS